MKNGLNLLLIEDSTSDAHLLNFALQDGHPDQSYSIHHEYRLASGLESLQKNSVDAVILDINLPDASGVEGLKAIRAQNSRVPIIVLTGMQDKSLVVSALKLGAQDFLFKDSLQSTDVSEAIQQAIQRQNEISKVLPLPLFQDEDQLEIEIENSLNKNDFEIRYQTEIEVETKEIVGVQANLQWNHPQYGPTPARRFARFLRPSSIVDQLQRWMVDEAISHLKTWFSGVKPLEISLALPQILHFGSDQVDEALARIQRLNLVASRFRFEISEQQLLANPSECASILDGISSRGFGILIDDFQGHCSSIRTLELHRKSFLRFGAEMGREGRESAGFLKLMKSMVDLARGKNIVSIAGPVENESELNSLKLIGCNRASGLYLQKSAPPSTVSVMLRVYPAVEF